jgi:L-ascorbate metabolism protein UlaG (beta-lactamase superfamily)
VVVADAYRSLVGPTGRGLTADICTYSHAESAEAPRAVGRATKGTVPATSRLGIVRPTSLESAFLIDGPGEYEVHEVLVTGVRTFRDDVRGAERGLNTSFVYELDGVHVAHLGDVGHVLSQETLGELGAVEVVCVPVGSRLSAAQAAELVAQLDASLVVPLPVGDDEEKVARDLERFLKEMSVSHPQPVPRLSVTVSSLPQEATVVVLEPRNRS